MADIGISKSDMFEFFRVVAGVLHLGNIEFEDSGGSSGELKEVLHVCSNILNIFSTK